MFHIKEIRPEFRDNAKIEIQNNQFAVLMENIRRAGAGLPLIEVKEVQDGTNRELSAPEERPALVDAGRVSSEFGSNSDSRCYANITSTISDGT